MQKIQDADQWLHELVKAAIAEDIGPGDLTSLACLEPDPVQARIVAKKEGVLSGLRPAFVVFEVIDSANSFRPIKDDGEIFERGDVLVEIDGFNQTVLASERAALNFLAHLSGVATLTRQFVEAVKGTGATILDTRKTTPGWRMLEKAAVVHGGGSNHRIGLYDMVLIKDNHIAAAGSISGAVKRVRDYLDTPDFRLQFDKHGDEIDIEVEVTTEAQLVEAIDAGVGRLLLDNQSPESLARLVARARKLNSQIKLEASGNVTLETVRQIAAAGVDFISVGGLTHSAPAADLSMQITGPGS